VLGKRRRWPETTAGGEMWLGVTASDLHAREGGETGDNRLVMILTPRRGFGGGLLRKRSGGAVSGQGVEAAAVEKLSRHRVSCEGGGCGLGANLGHEGGSFIGRLRRLGVQTRDTARAGRCRTAAGLGLESEPGAGKGKALTGGTCLPARGEGREREAWAVWAGKGESRLGRAERRE
jgi:hypothetical protein